MLKRLKKLLTAPALIYLGASVLSRAGGLFLIPIYTRRLAPIEFGTLALANTLAGLLPILFSLGLISGLSKVYFDSPVGQEPAPRFGAVARLLLTWVAGLGLGSCAVVALLWPPLLLGFTRYQMLLTIVSGMGLAGASIPDSWFRAQRRPVPVAVMSMGSFVMLVATALYLVVFRNRGLDGVIEAQCGSAALMGWFGVVFTGTRLRGAAPEGFRRGSALTFSLPMVPHFLANWAFGVGDRWVLASCGSQALLGQYAIGLQLAAPVAMTASAVNDSQAPMQGRAFQESGSVGLLAAIKRDLLLSAKVSAIPYVGLLLLSPLIKMLLGPRYLDGLYLLPFVGLAGIIEGTYYPPINGLFYLGHTRLIPVITSVSAVVSLALTAPLTVFFGLPGLVGARLASTTLRSALCWAIAIRALGKGSK